MANDEQPRAAFSDYPVSLDHDLLDKAAERLGLVLRMPKNADRGDIEAMLVNLVAELTDRVIKLKDQADEIEDQL